MQTVKVCFRLLQSSQKPFRVFSTNSIASPMTGLEQFRDPVSREKRFSELVGRGWSVTELRRKNFDDLHKLWYVLYKERNMLLTEAYISNRNGAYFPQPERRQKVKKSMAAIKVVLGERKRDKIAQYALKMARLDEETKGVLADEYEGSFQTEDHGELDMENRMEDDSTVKKE